MSQARSFNGGVIPFDSKMSEAGFVAYVRFVGVVNAPSRMWMVRDWARRRGYQLVGAPGCYFAGPNGDSGDTACEVRWGVVADAGTVDGEIGVRWLEARDVLVAYHRGERATLHATADALRAWGAAQGYRTTGERCEIYHSDLNSPAGRWLTEIQLYVEASD